MTKLEPLQMPHPHYPHERCGYILAASNAARSSDSISIWKDRPGFTAVLNDGERQFPFNDSEEFCRFHCIHLEGRK